MSSRFTRNTHCSYCGQPFAPQQAWPRTCAHCGHTSFLNPLPVVVMLVPVAGGVLAVRRAIEPGYGQLALPGGYLNIDETWQAAGTREVFEETGVSIDPAGIREFAVRSTRDGSLLVFGLAGPLADLPPFQYDAETAECLVLKAPAELAFPLHTEILAEYFRWAAR